MEIDYQRDDNGFKNIDYDALFTAICSVIILTILGSSTDSCDQYLRAWLFIKGMVLIFRLAIKSGFHDYQLDAWHKIVLALIKVFSVAWICVGIYWIDVEEKCDSSSILYIGICAFIVMFSFGLLVFIAIFIVALCALRRNTREDRDD